MTHFRTILVACAIAAAISAPKAATGAASRAHPETARAGDLSAAKRSHKHRQVRRYQVRRHQVRPSQAPHDGTYRRGNDPSLGPNGQPYRVPGYLRNQCHIDEGYGRFSACPNE